MQGKIFFFFILLISFAIAFDPTFGNSSYPKYDEDSFEKEIIEMKQESDAFKFFKPIVGRDESIGRRYRVNKGE